MPQALEPDNLLSELASLRQHFELPKQTRLKRRPEFNHKILSATEVKHNLNEIFLGKCAYCETKLTSFETEVHHHRPLMNAKDSYGKTSVSVDHYAWYAYEWDNLLLACVQCARFKANQFPIEGERVQPFTPWDHAGKEKPCLLDPSIDNIFEHLTFKRTGRCTNISRRGKITISVLKLNRSDLVRRRQFVFESIYGALQRMKGGSYEVCLSAIKELLSDEKNHVGAARAWILSGMAAAAKKNDLSVRHGEFEIELAGFISLSNDDYWRRFSSALIAGEERISPALIGSSDEIISTKNYSARVVSVSIKDFKGIRLLDLNFTIDNAQEKGMAPAVVLLGENSSGKSSILQAIALGLMEPKLRGQLRVSYDDLIRKKALRPSDMYRPIDSSETESVIKLRFDSGHENVVKLRRDGSIEAEGFVSGLVLGYGAHRSFDKEELGAGYFRKSSSIASLFERNRLMPHSLNWLESVPEDKFLAVARAMREILNLQAHEEIYRSESGEVYITSSDGNVSLLQLSDGYRSVLAMCLDIIRNMIREWDNLEDSRGLVLIDEIETHLHPRWKMHVVGALRSAMPQVQFVFTTHDPLCLRGMLDGEVHVLVKDEQGTISEMTGLPNISDMRAEQLLTSEFFGLASTVDPSVESNLDRVILTSKGTQEHAESFSDRIEGFEFIGDTPEQQIVNKALRMHITEQLRSKRLDRSEVRKEAVELILQRLRASVSDDAQ